MSGAALSVQISGIPEIQVFADRLAGVSPRVLVESVVSVLESQTRRRISGEKTAPDGSDWAALDLEYAARKREESSGGLLEFRGDLLDSITTSTSGDSGEVGTNDIKAATHQFGDSERGIEGRAFIGVSESNGREIGEVIGGWIRGVLNA